MSLFAYTGRDALDRARRGVVEADSPKAARAALQREGIVTDRLAPAALKGKFGKEVRARFYGEAGMLLKAGFTLSQALDMLIGETSGNDAVALAALKERIVAGDSLSKAVSSLALRLPGFEDAALKTAEETGVQGDMLLRLSEFIEADRAVRERIRAAMTYPAAVLVLAVALLSLMVFVVLPKAAVLFPGGTMPASAAFMVRFGPILMGAAIAVLAGGAAAVAFLAARARRGGTDAMRYERFLLALPLARRLLPLLWTSRFALTMGLLLDAGLTPQAAVAPAGSATGSETVAALAASAANDVKNGLPLSKAVAFIAPVAPHLATWVSVGEKSGALASLLPQAAARARGEYEKILSGALALLEPALVAAVGAVVLFVALSVIRPMLALTTRGL